MKSDEVPEFKRGEKLDLKICHWSLFAPNQSGLYETVKELVKYENRIEGVLGGICNPDKPEGGEQDPDGLVTQSHEWAMQDANLHVIHYRELPFTDELEPRMFAVHGTIESCVHSEMSVAQEAGRSFTSSVERIRNCDATITFSNRAQYYWSQFDPTGKKVFRIHKGIDLEKYTPLGMKEKLSGAPKIGYAEIPREIKYPLDVFYAVNEYYKLNKKAKFHPIGLSQNWRMWFTFIQQGNFRRLLGEHDMGMNMKYPAHWYRAFDMLISPVQQGEPSRCFTESMACGCPTITWDSDPFPDDTYAFRKAKYCDPLDLASKIGDLWEEIKADPVGIRERARKVAEEHYSAERMAQEFVKVARQTINR